MKIPKNKKNIIDTLMKRDDIFILKQDRRKGVVILDRTVYSDKCVNLLNSEQF